jgi:hypothetical protein
MTYAEWRLAMLIAHDLTELLKKEQGQEDAVLFLHASLLKSFRHNLPFIVSTDIAFALENNGELFLRHPRGSW